MGLREKLLAENPYRAKRMPLFAAFCKSEAEGYEGGVNAALDAVRDDLRAAAMRRVVMGS